jgi:hypothetical protein
MSRIGWRLSIGLAFTLVALHAPRSGAQEASLDAPDEAVVGAPLEVAWTGPDGPQDFIGIDREGMADREYGDYAYTKKGTPAKLRAPDVPGRYVIRYHSGASGYAVLAARPLVVVDTTATFEPLGPVEAGGAVEIVWQGPGHAQDFISIDEAGAADRSYGPYAYAKSSPVSIRAPDGAGTYAVRYHLAGSYRVIGEAPLTVGAVEATLEAPGQVAAGGEIEVAWSGPDGRGDFISIDPHGAEEREYGNYEYTGNGSPASIIVPEAPGKYEVRYHLGQSWGVIGRRPLEVLPNRATVAGPPTVAGGSDFEVAWTGPDNRGDFLTIVPQGAGPREYTDYAYTRGGSPGRIEAPLEPGAYELRYVTGQSRAVLASSPIEVTPGVVPGHLRVTRPAGAGAASPAGAVEVILDASGSMLQRLDGRRRIEIAKDALGGLLRDVVPAGTPFALRVFGHREADSCRTDLEIPLAPLAAAGAAAKIRGIEAKNLAKTPIAASLERVPEDLAGVEGPAVVVLVTDGEETCGGDPRAVIERLTRSGFDIRVNIVGFAVDDLALEEEFEAWARAGGGRYVEAHDGEQLARAMGSSLEEAFEVLDGSEVVATGVVGGDPVELPPGAYRVRLVAGARPVGEVTIEPGGEHGLVVE